MKRNKFNPSRLICSSEHISASIQAHKRELELNHANFMFSEEIIITSLSELNEINIRKIKQVRVFGSYINLAKPVEFYIQAGFTHFKLNNF